MNPAAALTATLGATLVARVASAQLPQNVSAAIANIESVYSGPVDADFTSTFFPAAYATTTTQRGHVWFLGQQVEWVFTNPAGQRVVTDGKTSCSYDASSRLLFVEKASPSAFLSIMSFFSFAPSLTFQLQHNASNTYVLATTLSTSGANGFAKAFFDIDSYSSAVVGVNAIDNQTNRVRVDFSNIRVGGASNTSHFVFQPPAGTTFVGTRPIGQCP